LNVEKEDVEICIMRSLMIDTLCQIVLTVKSNKMRKAGNVARMKVLMKAFRVVVVKPRGKRPIERPKLLKYNIKLDLTKQNVCGLDSSGSEHGPVARSL